MKKITVASVLKDGVTLGIKNFPSLLLVAVLYLVTIWIPYINVGTTIALANIPLELSKGKIINPTFIFDAKFRRYMPEYFTLVGIRSVALSASVIFLVIPAIILRLAWSQAIFIMFDKKISPVLALVKSNEITYGYKATLFFIGLIIGILFGIIIALCRLIDEEFGFCMIFILSLVTYPIVLGCNAVAYKGLSAEDQPEVVVNETVE